MKKWMGLFLLATFVWVDSGASSAAEPVKIVLIAGRPSHGPGDHEFNAGITLLAKCLKEMGGIEPVVVKGGWPEDESVF